jgi:hypothetical protein
VSNARADKTQSVSVCKRELLFLKAQRAAFNGGGGIYIKDGEREAAAAAVCRWTIVHCARSLCDLLAGRGQTIQ